MSQQHYRVAQLPTDGEVTDGFDAGKKTVIEVEVYYDKGGRNWFTGRDDSRGFWLSVQPVYLKDGFRSLCIGGNGRRRFLEAATRFSRKRLEQLGDAIISQESTQNMIAFVAQAEGVNLVDAAAV